MISAVPLMPGQDYRRPEPIGVFDADTEVKVTPFPARRQFLREYRPTMHNVSSYVLKTHFMDYGLSRVKSLWIDEEVTNEYSHGTPDQPLFASQTLVHNCRICREEGNFDTNNESFFSSDSPVKVHDELEHTLQEQQVQGEQYTAVETPSSTSTADKESRRYSNPFWDDLPTGPNFEENSSVSERETVNGGYKRPYPFEGQTGSNCEGVSSIALDDFVDKVRSIADSATPDATLNSLYKYCDRTKETGEYVNTLVGDMETRKGDVEADKEHVAHTQSPTLKRACLDHRDVGNLQASTQFVLMQLATDENTQKQTAASNSVTHAGSIDNREVGNCIDGIALSDVSDLSESELVTPESSDEDKIVLSPPSPSASTAVSALAMALNTATTSTGFSVDSEPSDASGSDGESDEETIQSDADGSKTGTLLAI
ncbi:hypothetical protein SARC_12624 [Sphaeroforma arctica JP610]|uniref:Uncharacterized protein n=1 Tax=Sphaeroforma arctica JP610 TaxID=667725 RepID=A0A0L0FEC2_9EUKA|nr:hypothetical protein SARC_12624 [Sphaeroforma arctica JP610]KNC74836.1 hypothetical protein SARC_12624 [Sphaeroforma arctica JP610]|eukprot:XP_014148738.1 hypothetical protein SARC_12624 [Sphaeroforma arctica JP610]